MSGVLTLVTLVAFAANSLLCRMALATGSIDPIGFTAIRVGSGAIVLLMLVSVLPGARHGANDSGSWGSALALFVYALGFSLAYISLDTGVGALVLFGAVQATMITLAMLAGERPRRAEWLGIAVALGGLAALVSPGVRAPDPVGVALMLASGIGWGVYSVRGRGSLTPTAATAGNFLRAVPMVALSAVVGWGSLEMDVRGVTLAIVSGAVTSGLGYVLWYVVLRRITTTQAAAVQLAVPVLAAFGGVAFLAEVIDRRLAVSSALILGGVAVAIWGRRPDTLAPPPSSVDYLDHHDRHE